MSQEEREMEDCAAPGHEPGPSCASCARAPTPAPDTSAVAVDVVRARLAGQLLREVIFELDADGRLGFAGLAWAQLVGTPASSWQGRLLVDVFHPEDRDAARALLRRAVAGGAEPVRQELRLDGGAGRWVELSACGVPGTRGEVVGSLVDVTARRRAEEAATTRERYLGAVVEVQRRLLAPDPSGALFDAILEPLGQACHASRSYIFEFHRNLEGQLLLSQRAEWCAPGVSRELENPGTLGRRVEEAFRPEQWQRLSRGEPVQGLPTIFAPELVPTLVSQGIQSLLVLPLWVHGELFGFIGFDNCDVARAWSPMEVELLSGACGALSLALEQRSADAQRVRTEATLRRTEAGFHLLIEGFPDPVMVHAAGGTLLSVNPAMVHYLGYQDPAELLGCNLLEFVRPEDRGAARLHLEEAQDGSLAARAQEVPLLRRDGAVVVADLVTLGVLFDGAPAHVTVARDFTERKHMQAQLMLGDRMASMGMLAAGIAHELNNPLAYVLSNLEFLRRTVGAMGTLAPPPGPEELMECRQVLDDARDGAERMRQIVRQLKVFSRVDDSHEEPVDVHRVLDSVTQMAASEIRPRARLVKEYASVPPVRGNEGKLFQVFLNLVINAAHAIEEGRMEANEIRLITSLDAQGRVVVDVRDTGCGIAPEHVRRIFDPFFTTKAPGLGTGLGLSICDTIVRALGGHIAVESAPGRGTTFRVALHASSHRAARVA